MMKKKVYNSLQDIVKKNVLTFKIRQRSRNLNIILST